MEEALIKRVMPHDEEAESSVIGAMLLDNEAIMVASEMITGEDFYQKQMGLVYDTMVELYNAGKPVEPVILHTSLREKGIPEEMCGVDQILRWMDQVTTSANIKYYAEIVAEKSVARRSIRMLEENANTLYMGSEKLEDTLADLEKKVFDLAQRGNGSEFVPIRQVVINVMKKIDAASKTRGRVTGLETGFMDLESGAVDAVAMDIVVASYQIESRNADFTILDESIATEEYGIGFAKGNEALRDTVQQTLEEMAEDGTMAEISTKWFGEDITTIGK